MRTILCSEFQTISWEVWGWEAPSQAEDYRNSMSNENICITSSIQNRNSFQKINITDYFCCGTSVLSALLTVMEFNACCFGLLAMGFLRIPALFERLATVGSFLVSPPYRYEDPTPYGVRRSAEARSIEVSRDTRSVEVFWRLPKFSWGKDFAVWRFRRADGS